MQTLVVLTVVHLVRTMVRRPPAARVGRRRDDVREVALLVVEPHLAQHGRVARRPAGTRVAEREAAARHRRRRRLNAPRGYRISLNQGEGTTQLLLGKEEAVALTTSAVAVAAGGRWRHS